MYGNEVEIVLYYDAKLLTCRRNGEKKTVLL